MKKQTLHEFLKANGGVSKVAKSLNLTARGVYKWSNKNALPRTEYTFLSRLCGGEGNDSLIVNNDNFLSRLCGGEGCIWF